MPFNPAEFHARLSQSGGVAYSHNYDVEVPSVVGRDRLTQLDQGTGNNLRFRCASITWPGRAISPMEMRTYGPTRHIGGIANYTDIDMQIILSPDLRERRYFLSWQDLVVGDHRRIRTTNDRMFDLGYYNDYISDQIVINQYAQNNRNPVYSLRLVEAYPLRIGDVQSSWESTEVQRLPITLAYRYFIDQL